MFKFIKDLIAPKKCYSCNQEGHFLCPKCLSKMSNFCPQCYACKQESANFVVHKECQKGIYYDRLIILSHYKNYYIKKLIKDAKFYSKKDIFEDFARYLSNSLIKNIGDLGLAKSNFVLVPVPLHFIKKLYRGYNQAEVLAKYIHKYSKISIETKLVKKQKYTRQQSLLSRQKRLSNLQNSFKINKNLVDNIDKKVFIIVDDVVSTGTTINEISKNLKKVGVKYIIGLVIASN